MPKVSAIIPTQRRPQMLREAAASVLGQTFRDLELIIVANAATPDAIAAAFDLARHDARVSVVNLAHGSLPGARNAGIAVARGEWVGFLDDDDLWLPSKIADQLAEAERTGADLIACGMVQFNAHGDIGLVGAPIPEALTLSEALTLYNCLPGGASGALVRMAAIKALGGFDERLRACEDWDMWRRLSWRHRIAIVPRVLARYRIHDGSMSRVNLTMQRAELRHLVKLTIDTPSHLRPMVGRAWREKFRREAANAYAWLDRKSGGYVQPTWRAMRKLVKS